MMDRFRRILRRHPIDDQETPLIPKEEEKSIAQRVTSAIRKRVMKRKGYTKVATDYSARGRGRRKRASAVKALSSIRSVIRRRKKIKRPRKMHK